MKSKTSILVALIVAFSLLAYFYSGLQLALAIGGVLVLLALLLVYRTTIFKFISEVRVELEKCSWPWDPQLTGLKKYKELLESTLVVIISVVLLGGFVSTSDLILAHVVGALTGGGIVAGLK